MLHFSVVYYNSHAVHCNYINNFYTVNAGNVTHKRLYLNVLIKTVYSMQTSIYLCILTAFVNVLYCQHF